MCRSVRHSPAAPTRTSTSSGSVTFGSETSSTDGRSWYLCSRTAFISARLLRGVGIQVSEPARQRMVKVTPHRTLRDDVEDHHFSTSAAWSMARRFATPASTSGAAETLRARCRSRRRRSMVSVEAEMHELAIAESLVEAVQTRTGGQTVRSIRLQVGRLSGVVPDALMFAFELAAHGTPLQGSQLLIDEPAGRLHCRTCQVDQGKDD